jgi:hypothetical protein
MHPFHAMTTRWAFEGGSRAARETEKYTEHGKFIKQSLSPHLQAKAWYNVRNEWHRP